MPPNYPETVVVDSGNPHIILGEMPNGLCRRTADVNFCEFADELVRRYNAFPQAIKACKLCLDWMAFMRKRKAEGQTQLGGVYVAEMDQEALAALAAAGMTHDLVPVQSTLMEAVKRADDLEILLREAYNRITRGLTEAPVSRTVDGKAVTEQYITDISVSVDLRARIFEMIKH